ncbi:hypothetical protein D3C72_1546450 [compost metagenome]
MPEARDELHAVVRQRDGVGQGNAVEPRLAGLGQIAGAGDIRLGQIGGTIDVGKHRGGTDAGGRVIDVQHTGAQGGLVLERTGLEASTYPDLARLAGQGFIQACRHRADVSRAIQHEPARLHAFKIVLARAQRAIHRPVRRHVVFRTQRARPFLGLPVGP